MFLRYSILLLSLLFIENKSFGQENNAPATAVYIEIAGKGFVSANVDFPIDSKNRITLAFTMLDHEFAKDQDQEEYPTLTLPTPGVMYFHLFGQEKHYFEAGAGLSISPVFWREYSENDSALSLHGSLGYRLQTPENFFLRAGLTPFYRVNWMFLPLVGVSLGYSW